MDNVLTMENLEMCFYFAKEHGADYIGLLVDIGEEEPEVIINSIENADNKLLYIKNAYDELLNHKFSKGIKIIGFTYGNSFEDIERDFFWVELLN